MGFHPIKICTKAIAFFIVCLITMGCDSFKLIPIKVNERDAYQDKENEYRVKVTADCVYGANAIAMKLSLPKDAEVNLDSLQVTFLPDANQFKFWKAEFVSDKERIRAARKIVTKEAQNVVISIRYLPLINHKESNNSHLVILPNSFSSQKGIPLIRDSLRISLL